MRIAAVYLSHFIYLAEVRRRPDLKGVALIVGDGEPPDRVLDCAPQLAESGVFRSTRARQAQSRAPDALWLAPDYPYYSDTWEQALDRMWQISPEVEDGGLGECCLNIEGLQPHYGGSERAIGQAIVDLMSDGLSAPSVGIANGKYPARAAAITGLEEVTVIAPGEEAAYLSDLGVEVLPFGPGLIDRLRLFGLDEIGDVARLSQSALLSQFGRQGEELHQMARGIDPRPLLPRHVQPALEEWLSFDGPVSSVEVLVLAVRQLVSRLAVPLNGRGCRQLSLRAGLPDGRTWERKVVFREAVSDVSRLQFIARTTVAETPPNAPVLSLGLRLSNLAGETGRQLSLGERRDTDNLQEAVRQLKARYGQSPLYQCVEAEPWSVIPEDRYLLVESDA